MYVQMLTGTGRAYIAPVGTPEPAVTAVPAAPWVDLGPTEEGVALTFDQDIEKHRHDRATGPVKVDRTEEDITVEVGLVEATAAAYARALNNKTVVNTAGGVGVAPTSRVGLARGFDVATHALLIRAKSPAFLNGAEQYFLPIVFEGDALEVGHQNGEHVVINHGFGVLWDSSQPAGEEMGRLTVQTGPIG